MNNLRFVIIVLFLPFVTHLFAHEEPAKTLREKSEKQRVKTTIMKARIKACTTWNIAVNNGMMSENKSKSLVQEYDSAGNLTGIAAFKNDSLTERVSYTYNASGDMISDIDYSANGVVTEKNMYVYDQDGRVVSGESYNGENVIASRFEYQHNSNARSITFKKLLPDNAIEYTLQYFYDGDYDLSDYIRAEKVDSAGHRTLSVEQTYNTRKLLATKKVVGETDATTYTFQYLYDETNNLIEVTKANNQGTTDWKRVYTYDGNGNRTGMKSFDGAGKLQSHQIYTYEYFK